MDKKITIALLMFAALVQLPAVVLVLHQVAFAGLSIELALLLFVFTFVVLMGICFPGGQANESRSSISFPSLFVVVAASLGATSWGIFSNEPVWVWRAAGLCLSAAIALLAGFSSNRLFNLALLLSMVPFPLWKTAPELHSIGQWLSSSFAGCILDICKVFYFTKGNVLGLVSTEFLQNETCSGVSFIYPLGLLVVAYGCFKEYRFVRTVYLMVVYLFWAVIADGVWIAYQAFVQDGQSLQVPADSSLSSILRFSSVLFLTWSGDQFYSAFSGSSRYRDADISMEPSRIDLPKAHHAAESRMTWMVLWCMVAGIVSVGAWSIYSKPWGQALSLRQSQVVSAVEDLKLESMGDGWILGPATKSKENFSPRFRHTPNWVHLEWELTRELSPEQSREGKMQLRIDGIWIQLPKPDWLWRWYGWRTEPVSSDDNRSYSFGMKRSLVEEAYVVTKGVGVVDHGALSGSVEDVSPVVQVSLVHESVRPISENQRRELKELHARWVEAIEKQLGFDATIGNQIR